jgi:NADPH:quinone reductase-like Zn-dependent oxidoreductase
MPKAVRYDEFGGIDVLGVEEVERPVPGAGQVLVRVKAAGINPSEAVIRTGAVAQIFPSTFPSGQALALGVAAGRIDTIADYAAAAKHGVKTDGGAEAGPGATVLAELAGLIADGHLEVPIANVYPLAQVREAYTERERRHTRGKIVLRP